MKTRDILLAVVFLVFTTGIILYYNFNTKHISDNYYQQVKEKVDSAFKHANSASIISAPQKIDKSGNYILSKNEWDKLERYIIYQANQTEELVQRSREETSKDIDRLNIWITIWIGILGLFGAFIPFIVNFAATKDFDKTIKTYDKKILDIDTALTKSDTALKNTKNVENILTLINTLSNLKYIEGVHRISALLGVKKEEYLALKLTSFRNNIAQCRSNEIDPISNPVFKECIKDFCLATRQIKTMLTKRNLQDNLTIIESNFNDLLINANGNQNEIYTRIEKSFDSLIHSLRN
jgi:hypothetical protein